MKASRNDINLKLKVLQEVLKEFISFFQQNIDYKEMVYELWSAKDILGHITFWHESFARNISALGNNTQPNVLKGKLSEVNQESITSTSSFYIPELIEKLQVAQKTIESNIFNENIDNIPYKKGSRAYSRIEHLDIVTNHIKKHLNDLNKQFN